MSTEVTFNATTSKKLTYKESASSSFSDFTVVTGVEYNKTAYSVMDYFKNSSKQEMYIGFEQTMSSTYKYRKIEGASILFDADYEYSPGIYSDTAELKSIDVHAATNRVSQTGTDIPGHWAIVGYARPLINLTGNKATVRIDLDMERKTAYTQTSVVKKLYETGITLAFQPTKSLAGDPPDYQEKISYYVYSEKTTPKPRLIIKFADTNRTISFKSVSPGAGSHFSPTEQLKFSCTLVKDSEDSFTDIWPQSGQFRWRVQSATEYSYANLGIQAEKLSYNYSIGANTLSGKNEYQFVFTLNTGETISSSWTLFDVSDTTPLAPTIIKPKDVILDGNDIIEFKWTHRNSSGLGALKSEIQISDSGSFQTYSSYIIDGEVYTKTLPAGTLSSGKKYWRVRTYNKSGTAGPFSTASFTTITAPSTPAITFTNTTALAAIRWSTTEQLAYQVELNGEIVKTDFGSANTYAVPDFLENHKTHTFRVRAQNAYGVWSNWGSASLQVNMNVGVIALAVAPENGSALLNWSSVLCDFYRIYRDDICIAQLDYPATFYTDTLVCGLVTYKIRGVTVSQGIYSESPVVTTTVAPEYNRIKALEDAEWLDLELSNTQYRQETIKRTKNVQLIHVAGREYADAEIGEHSDESMRIRCAFKPEDSWKMKRLEAMTGQTVIAQTNGGRYIIGIIDSFSISATEFYTAYDFSISRTHYNEDILND